MSLGDSMKRLIGIEDIDESEDITEEEVNAEKEKLAGKMPKPEPAPEKKHVPQAPSKPLRGGFGASQTQPGAFKLVLIEPKTFEECPKLVNSLKSRKPVIINLERLETEVARKIFDFLSGAVYALNGNVQKVANNIFIFAPENVDIAGGTMQEQGRFEFPLDENKGGDSNPWR